MFCWCVWSIHLLALVEELTSEVSSLLFLQRRERTVHSLAKLQGISPEVTMALLLNFLWVNKHRTYLERNKNNVEASEVLVAVYSKLAEWFLWNRAGWLPVELGE